jgi:hypothetical protein
VYRTVLHQISIPSLQHSQGPFHCHHHKREPKHIFIRPFAANQNCDSLIRSVRYVYIAGDWSLPDKGGDLAGWSSSSFGSKRFSYVVGSYASSRPGRGQPSLSFHVFVVDGRSGYVCSLGFFGDFCLFFFYFLSNFVCAAFCLGIVFGTSFMVGLG